MSLRTKPRAAVVHARRLLGRVEALAVTEVDRVRARGDRADVALFHAYAPPPSGGGNQFVRALVGELARRGLEVEWNRISGGTPACLFNSFNFDFRRLRRFHREGVRMVHRVDGPIGVYRGFDDGTDARITAVNRQLADATVFQSRYSLEKHRELGIELVAPVVIPNAPDPALFFPAEMRGPVDGRPVRVIVSSWSTNRAKGRDVLDWLDEHLDPGRMTVTYVGRAPRRFSRVEVVEPLPSAQLADLLRAHDVFLTASRHEACSNALLEALACGLPAVYVASGSNGELVGRAGVAFERPDEVPEAVEHVAARLDEYRSSIALVSLAEVADRYLAALRL